MLARTDPKATDKVRVPRSNLVGAMHAGWPRTAGLSAALHAACTHPSHGTTLCTIGA